MAADPREQFSDLRFPVAGIDLAEGYGAQRPQTTRQGVNVRAAEPSTQRLRGGQRPGLSKYVSGVLTGRVQNLNSVVTASGAALLANFVWNGTTVADPSSPGQPSDWPPGQTSRIPAGQVIPTGGTLVQPNKKVPMRSAVTGSGIKFVQAAPASSESTSGDGTQNLIGPITVTAGNLLVIAASNGNPGASPVTGAGDSIGTSYTHLASVTLAAQGGNAAVELDLWYGFAPTSGPNTANVTVGGDLVQLVSDIAFVEYSGVSSTSPVDASSSGTVNGNFSTLTGGGLAPAGSQELLLVAFSTSNTVAAVSPATKRTSDISATMTDILDVIGGGTSTLQGSAVGGTNGYAWISVLFIPK